MSATKPVKVRTRIHLLPSIMASHELTVLKAMGDRSWDSAGLTELLPSLSKDSLRTARSRLNKLGHVVARKVSGTGHPGRNYIWSTTELGKARVASSLDPRDPDYTREGIFIYHNCWKCDNGKKPCVSKTNICEYPHARND